jgi:predicted alpha/beta-fold hydrolase
MQRTTNRLSDLGWRAFRMDLRGTGAGLHLARRFYNAAGSDDVRVVAEHLATTFPGVPLAIAGFSLGASIVVKLAGECAERPLPSLVAVAAAAPPLDLVRCSELIGKYPLYDAFYVHYLTAQVAEHEKHFPDLPRTVFPRRTTLRQFDELVTAPRWGYADALDYYRQASALPWVRSIRVPTLLLTARDDPFVAVDSFEAIDARPPLEVHIADYGGHLGFLGADGSGGIRWAEAHIVRWLQKQIESVA